MAREHRILRIETCPRVNAPARIAFNDLPDENERRAMRKAKKVISDQ